MKVQPNALWNRIASASVEFIYVVFFLSLKSVFRTNSVKMFYYYLVNAPKMEVQLRDCDFESKIVPVSSNVLLLPSLKQFNLMKNKLIRLQIEKKEQNNN